VVLQILLQNCLICTVYKWRRNGSRASFERNFTLLISSTSKGFPNVVLTFKFELFFKVYCCPSSAVGSNNISCKGIMDACVITIEAWDRIKSTQCVNFYSLVTSINVGNICRLSAYSINSALSPRARTPSSAQKGWLRRTKCDLYSCSETSTHKFYLEPVKGSRCFPQILT
jgi:hypothetical protein